MVAECEKRDAPTRPATAGAALAGVIASASKLAFLLLALTACAGFLIGKLASSDFMMLAGMAFAFYFSNKGETGPGAAPYAGK